MNLNNDSNTPVRYDKEGTNKPIARYLHNQFKTGIYIILFILSCVSEKPNLVT